MPPPLFPFHQPHERTCGSTAIKGTPIPRRHYTLTDIHVFSRIRTQALWHNTVASIVVRASESRPEGLEFESDDESLTNEDRGRQKSVVDSKVLRAIVKQNPGHTVRDYVKEPRITPTTIAPSPKHDWQTTNVARPEWVLYQNSLGTLLETPLIFCLFFATYFGVPVASVSRINDMADTSIATLVWQTLKDG
ncbi:hypothetical protein TNCV_310961 [Trichonephila clavipes]|nr:hypothetical protein TNCV_310961 [Trichonephila clavipes]